MENNKYSNWLWMALFLPLGIYLLEFLVGGLLLNYQENNKLATLCLNSHLVTLSLNILLTSALLLIGIYTLDLKIINTEEKPMGKIIVLSIFGILLFAIIQLLNLDELLKEKDELIVFYIAIMLLFSFSSYVASTAVRDRKKICNSTEQAIEENR